MFWCRDGKAGGVYKEFQARIMCAAPVEASDAAQKNVPTKARRDPSNKTYVCELPCELMNDKIKHSLAHS